MTRVYHHHRKWEDHAHGQYALTYGPQTEGSLRAAALLSSEPGIYAAMSAVVREWPHAAEHNLTNMEQNRQAWLGQAACCFELGVPAFVTKQAWWTLPEWVQNKANSIADLVTAEWEGSRAETLFGN